MTKKRFSLSCDLEDTEIISWLNNQKNISESIRLVLRKVIEEVGEQDFKDYLIESALNSISFVEPVKDTVVEPVKDTVVEPVKDTVVEPVKDAVVEPVKDAVVEPVKDAVVEPVKDAVKKFVKDKEIGSRFSH